MSEIECFSMCSCGTPLVPTFAFRGAEFYCVNCGNKYGMFDATTTPATPELLAQYEGLLAEWKENAGGKLLISRSYRRDCKQCHQHGGDHPSHATEEEKRADEIARIWMADRVAA